jgi:hypothetical protein
MLGGRRKQIQQRAAYTGCGSLKNKCNGIASRGKTRSANTVNRMFNKKSKTKEHRRRHPIL